MTCEWDDVPHLSADDKKQLLSDLPAHVRETRSKGIPALGSGAIYPIGDSKYTIDPLPSIPEHWRRCFGFDGGWHNTAVLWGAYDKDADMVYIYSEHKAGELPVPMHASAMKARGSWIPGVGDAGNTSQVDGKNMLKEYRGEGVNMALADKSVDAGIQAVYTRLANGTLKIYKTCTELLKELRIYRYDDKGKIVKKDDHLCDALRYLIYSGLKRAKANTPDQNLRTKEVTFGI